MCWYGMPAAASARCRRCEFAHAYWGPRTPRRWRTSSTNGRSSPLSAVRKESRSQSWTPIVATSAGTGFVVPHPTTACGPTRLIARQVGEAWWHRMLAARSASHRRPIAARRERPAGVGDARRGPRDDRRRCWLPRPAGRREGAERRARAKGVPFPRTPRCRVSRFPRPRAEHGASARGRTGAMAHAVAADLRYDEPWHALSLSTRRRSRQHARCRAWLTSPTRWRGCGGRFRGRARGGFESYDLTVSVCWRSNINTELAPRPGFSAFSPEGRRSARAPRSRSLRPMWFRLVGPAR